jgi:formylglycine-generating enzyme required for sulfatase activity
MKWQFIAVAILAAGGLPATAGTLSASLQKPADGLVLIQGGEFKDTRSNYFGKSVNISSFYIGKYAVTQKEWTEVMGDNPSRFKGDNLPVEMVTWYDAVEYCNQRSISEGLTPYYRIEKNERDEDNKPDPQFGDLDEVRWTVTRDPEANGYRLPTEAEWEYAASGGQVSSSYFYSGGDDIEDVGWYWRNSGDKELTGFWNLPALEQNHNQTKPVGTKKPNELGLYDMSGNVRQWCWDWYADSLQENVTDPKGGRSGYGRVWKGGGWMGAAFCTEPSYRGHLAANGKGPDQGFRVCRNK